MLHTLSDAVWVSSPAYPNIGPQTELLCDYVIRGPVAAGLQVSFAAERWVFCNKSVASLEVYDGGSDLSPLVDTVCMPPYNAKPVLVSGHVALLRYAVRGGAGAHAFASKFNATIRADNCNRELILPPGTDLRGADGLRLPYTSSTKAASSSSAPSECSLHLKTYPSNRIRLNITQMFLAGNSCTAGDVVSFYDSPYQRSVSFRQYCAPANRSHINYVIMSPKNELFITYKRTNYYPGAGAKASGQKEEEVGIKFAVATKYTGKLAPLPLRTLYW